MRCVQQTAKHHESSSPSVIISYGSQTGLRCRLRPGLMQSRVIAAQPSPPSPLSLNGRGGVGCVLLRNLPSPREHIFTHICFYRSTMRFIRFPRRATEVAPARRSAGRRPSPPPDPPALAGGQPKAPGARLHAPALRPPRWVNPSIVAEMWVKICPVRERGLGGEGCARLSCKIGHSETLS